ncbi:methyltransferase family protein [Mesorhizobium sp. IMUNJ 23232]|uniref:methyltransferase family protein n=1 Tax=Mesorhizobium sp. IMUNJ 23232 TaxID=3376064 RepID=UPI003791B42F
MRKSSAALGSVLFFIFVPCVVAGLAPYLLTDRYRMTVPPHPAVAVVAGILIAVGLGVLIHAFVRFAVEGLGTPAPIAPTARLVVGGVYRHVRNPMYLAVLSIILGQALLFSAVLVAVYAVAVAAAVVSFVRFYEEPVLASRYGAEYETYRRAVPGWLPRLTPWRQP